MKTHEKGLADTNGWRPQGSASTQDGLREGIFIAALHGKTKQLLPLCDPHPLGLSHEPQRLIAPKFHLIRQNPFGLGDTLGTQELLGSRAARSPSAVIVPIDRYAHEASVVSGYAATAEPESSPGLLARDPRFICAQ